MPADPPYARIGIAADLIIPTNSGDQNVLRVSRDDGVSRDKNATNCAIRQIVIILRGRAMW